MVKQSNRAITGKHRKDKQDKRIDAHAREFFEMWKRKLPQLQHNKYRDMEWEDCPVEWRVYFKRMVVKERTKHESDLQLKKRHINAEGLHKQFK